MLISKKFSFEAAHSLPNYHGKCEELHGHSYKFVVTIQGEVNLKDGMVLDFNKFKKIVNEQVIKKLDHKNLNDILDIPSAELIAQWIWQQLKNDFNLYEIKVWETENSWVTYNGK